MTLYEILKIQFKTNAAIGRRFPKKGRPRGSQGVGKWKTRGVPEDVAILCHLDPSIPYTHPKPADDPHHLIGHGQGGMGTKAHDLFVLPLCRKHHDKLHADNWRDSFRWFNCCW